MGLISPTYPYADPGSLMGGIREHRAILNHVLSEGYRGAAQEQDTNQVASSHSGAAVDNDQTQAEDITQTAITAVNHTITITPVLATNPNAGAFNFNYLQRYMTSAESQDLVARAGSEVTQSQGGGQNGYARLNDFAGVASDADNKINQREDVVQQFDVDITATVSNTTDGSSVDTAFNQARYRDIIANVSNISAQAVFANGQAQGTSSQPFLQVAKADGGTADNDLTQDSGITTPNNRVDLTATFDLRRFETGDLSPRTTRLTAMVNSDPNAVVSAINRSNASQEQAHDMRAAASVVETGGKATENGGSAKNTSNVSADNTESTTVTNSITILI